MQLIQHVCIIFFNALTKLKNSTILIMTIIRKQKKSFSMNCSTCTNKNNMEMFA